jgi:hypothetical protein
VNRFKPGDTVRIVTLKNHPTDQHRIYDFPEKIRWVGESIVPRSFIGKVPGGSIGIVVEIKEEQCKVLFFGGEVFGWVSENQLEQLEIHSV